MKQKRVPLIRQVGITDCGFACLTMLFNYYGYNIDISELKAKNSVGRNGLSLAKLKEICQENYFQFKAYKNFSSEMLESDRNSHPKTSRINQSESDRNSQS